jgi:signal peptidase II
MRKLVPAVVVLVIVLGLDQGSKAWAKTLSPGPHSVISGLWDWEPAANRGAAFSTFEWGNGIVMPIALSLVAAAVLVGIGIAAGRTQPEEHAIRIGYALVAGGALGNLLDRVRDGAVTDFIRWRIGEHRWPIFNVADAALLVGVAVLVVDRAVSHRRGKLARGGGAGRTMEG